MILFYRIFVQCLSQGSNVKMFILRCLFCKHAIDSNQQENSQFIVPFSAIISTNCRSKLTKPETYRLQREKSSSPKRSPKLGHKPMEIKDYGPIDSALNDPSDKVKHYPPHAYSRSNSGISLKHTNISSQNNDTRSKQSSQTKIPPTSQNPNISSNVPTTSQNTGVSGIPSPRGKPPAPPVRKSSDVTSCTIEQLPVNREEKSDSSAKIETDDPECTKLTSTSEASVTSSYLTRTCSLPRHKRMGKYIVI